VYELPVALDADRPSIGIHPDFQIEVGVLPGILGPLGHRGSCGKKGGR